MTDYRSKDLQRSWRFHSDMFCKVKASCQLHAISGALLPERAPDSSFSAKCCHVLRLMSKAVCVYTCTHVMYACLCIDTYI